MIKLLTGLAMVLLIIDIAGSAQAAVLTFDDIPGVEQNSYGEIGSYGGFDFSSDTGMSMDWIDTVDSRWNYGAVSGDFTMLNNYGGNAIIKSSTNQNFTFDGLYARIWSSGSRSVSIEGYKDGRLVYSHDDLTLDTNWNYFTGSSFYINELRLNFSNYFFVDNLSINQTPIPSTMLLLYTGLVILAGSKNRRGEK